jgi:NADH-quinone oxidoreductase subunit A
MTELVGYLLLFGGLAVFFLFIHLVLGRFFRPVKPDPDKLTIYECGEPTIGSAWVQFDLRYYVVALLFVIFDVEVAFFFPWAVVFGKANTLAVTDPPRSKEEWAEYKKKIRELIPAHRFNGRQAALEPFTQDVPFENPGLTREQVEKRQKEAVEKIQEGAHEIAWFAFWDIAVFFGVLLVGFAYLWRRGDINWVRSTAAEKAAEGPAVPAGAGPGT